MTALVIHAHRSPTRLVVAIRTGATITHTGLLAHAPDYEAARAEAQTLYPNYEILVPKLGELR